MRERMVGVADGVVRLRLLLERGSSRHAVLLALLVEGDRLTGLALRARDRPGVRLQRRGGILERIRRP